MVTACGTPGYMAPEVSKTSDVSTSHYIRLLSKILNNEVYGAPVDMWSLGTTTATTTMTAATTTDMIITYSTTSSTTLLLALPLYY